MNDTNSFIVTGRLTRDVELVELPSGAKLAKGSIASNRSYKKDDEWIEEVSFIDFKLFGPRAEALANKVGKGDRILLEGSIEQENFTTKEGQKVSKLVLKVDNFNPLSPPRQNGQERSETGSKATSTKTGNKRDKIPF